MKHTFVIVGAGMIGLSAAVALRKQGNTVHLVERGSRPEYNQEPQLRVSALAHHSRALLEALGVWANLPHERLGPYSGMEVWDHDSFGRIKFEASEVDAEDIGAIVENLVLEQCLWDAAVENGVIIHAQSQVSAEQIGEHQVKVQFLDQAGTNQELQADYLIAADGVNSSVRQRAQLPLTFWDYEQRGVVAALRTEQPHQGIARQVFLPTGPVALLPLGDSHQVSLVWSADQDLAADLMTTDDAEFQKRLLAASDNCLGQLELLTKRAAFPLKMQYAQRWMQQRLILVGDAAHSIHPLAGQGANLGFGDVEALVKVFAQGANPRLLREWERERKAAAVTMTAAMEAFKRGFGTANPVVKLIRGLGFAGADKFLPIKRALVQAALGSK